jgi:hypothetical protein
VTLVSVVALLYPRNFDGAPSVTQWSAIATQASNPQENGENAYLLPWNILFLAVLGPLFFKHNDLLKNGDIFKEVPLNAIFFQIQK